GLVAVSCRSCFGAMFAGAQFCPHCGAKAEQPVEADQSTMRCPGCGGEMRHERLADTTTIYECGGCGSAWLTPDTFTKLVADREERGAAAARGAAAGGLSKPKARRLSAGATRYVRCPVCDTMMNRVNFGDSSGVIVDTCAAHGIWFERDELHAIMAFVEQGGLARRANAQQDPRQHLRDLSFDSEEAARQRAAIRTLIVHLDESGRASGRSSWTDLLKVFFE
ncbi:MAG TPA: zf-TFIIB domain-containing protein, partial [Gemmatimonadaceae bacterium]|nr:zf-TFIIB domain-containing protein [Gemmatimonadaceae bacterium]